MCVFTLYSQTTSWISQTNILTGQNRLIYQSRHQSCRPSQHFVTHFLLDPTAFPIFDRWNKIHRSLLEVTTSKDWWSNLNTQNTRFYLWVFQKEPLMRVEQCWWVHSKLYLIGFNKWYLIRYTCLLLFITHELNFIIYLSNKHCGFSRWL